MDGHITTLVSPQARQQENLHVRRTLSVVTFWKLINWTISKANGVEAWTSQVKSRLTALAMVCRGGILVLSVPGQLFLSVCHGALATCLKP